MLIPWQSLNADTLDALIEEFVSREGTDYGHLDYSLQSKVEQVRAQLRVGTAVIVFDPETESCHITQREQVHE